MAFRFLPLISLSVALAISGCSTPPRVSSAAPLGLWVEVNVPPRWNPQVEQDVSETLAALLAAELRRAGYPERIELRRYRDEAQSRLPVLVIDVAEWRISRSGAAECLLNARLRTAEGEDAALGMIVNSDFTALRGAGGFSRPYELASALEDAAVGAMRDLRRRLAESGKLPGLPLR